MRQPSSLLLFLTLGLAPLGAQAPKPSPASASTPAIATPCDTCLPDIINFAKLDGVVWRGAQPTAEGFRALAKAGARTVVSFRSHHDNLALMKGTGLQYLRIPSRAWHPDEDNLVAFLKVLENPANHPVYIHCQQGRDRTGYNAVAYRMVVQGWDAETALREMKGFRFNKVWVNNPRNLRHLDVERLKARVKAAPAPVLVKVD